MISGGPKRRTASFSASTQKAASSVLEMRLARTFRVNQSMMAARLEEALPHWQVGDVGAPDLVGPLDPQPARAR